MLGERTREIQRPLVSEGLSISEAAKELKVGRRWVAEAAAKHGFPTNPPIRSRGAVETRLLRLLVAVGMDYIFAAQSDQFQRIVKAHGGKLFVADNVQTCQMVHALGHS